MGQRLNILIINDDDINNAGNRIIINAINFSNQVKTKTSVDEAFNYLTKTNYMTKKETEHPFPDLIFVNIDLPNKSGWDFLKSYKKMKNFLIKKPIIIMISSSTDSHDREKAMNISDVSNCYAKPLTTEIVCDVLFKYFPVYLQIDKIAEN